MSLFLLQVLRSESANCLAPVGWKSQRETKAIITWKMEMSFRQRAPHSSQFYEHACWLTAGCSKFSLRRCILNFFNPECCSRQATLMTTWHCCWMRNGQFSLETASWAKARPCSRISMTTWSLWRSCWTLRPTSSTQVRQCMLVHVTVYCFCVKFY